MNGLKPIKIPSAKEKVASELRKAILSRKMKEGEILYQGTPKETITPESLQTVYGVQSQVTWTEDQQAMIHYL